MSLKAQVRTDSLGNFTVYIDGSLDFENCLPFRQELQSLRTENPYACMTLDFSGLDFVGSSGISHLVETVRLLQTGSSSLQLCNVKVEFVRVFKLYNLEVTIIEPEVAETNVITRNKRTKNTAEI
jgi:anti-sigma B factor antagonist